MKVRDVSTGQEYEVPGADPKRAVLALFLAQVLYKHRPETVTWEVVEAKLPEYEHSIQQNTQRKRDGSISNFYQLWRFMAEEGLITTTATNQ